jgi:hypothetical protein
MKWEKLKEGYFKSWRRNHCFFYFNFNFLREGVMSRAEGYSLQGSWKLECSRKEERSFGRCTLECGLRWHVGNDKLTNDQKVVTAYPSFYLSESIILITCY